MGTVPVEPTPGARAIGLSDPEMDTVVRCLAASVNLRMMHVLMERRRSEPADGWLFLSEIAEALDEKPGTVGLAVQKLLPLLEEKREKGRRYFRSRYVGLEMVLQVP